MSEESLNDQVRKIRAARTRARNHTDAVAKTSQDAYKPDERKNSEPSVAVAYNANGKDEALSTDVPAGTVDTPETTTAEAASAVTRAARKATK